MQNEPNFQKSQMNVNPYNTTDYENKSDWTLGENEPNTNPIKANLRKAKMNVNSLITKDYRKKDDFAVQKNEPNSNPKRTQSNPIPQRDTQYAIRDTRYKPNSNPISLLPKPPKFTANYEHKKN